MPHSALLHEGFHAFAEQLEKEIKDKLAEADYVSVTVDIWSDHARIFGCFYSYAGIDLLNALNVIVSLLFVDILH
jgi:hypothetical protein